MPWCPKCRCEYEQGYMTCYDCETDLVDELVQIEESSNTEYDREVYLISAANSIEAEVMEALLTSNEIPVLKKYREAGAYLEIYMGTTYFGVDLYVPSKLLVKAKDIIKSNSENVIETENQISDEENIIEIDDKYNKKRRILTWIMLLIFIPGLLGVVIAILATIYHWIISI